MLNKFNRTFSCLAAAALALCVVGCKEEIGAGEPSGSDANQVIFTVGGVDKIETKSGACSSSRYQRDRIALSEPGDPDQLYLVETVEDLDATYYNSEIGTKGIPVYTETFTSNYSDFSTIPYSDGSKLSNGIKSYWSGLIQASQNRYAFDFTDGWPTASDALLFFMAAPADLENESDETLGYSDLNMAVSDNNGIIDFNYAAPAGSYGVNADATLLKDLLFTSKYVTKAQYKGEGATVLFYHTLAGVKFKSGNAKREGTNAEGTEAKITNIKRIELTHILSNGHCTVTPDQSYDNTNSNTDPDVAKSATASDWDWEDMTKAYQTYFINTPGLAHNTTQFPESTDFEGATVSGNTDTALGQMNLNNSDFSNTFFFVPQTTGEETILTIEYTIGNKQYKKSVKFSGKTWEPGKLYTYTLSANHVAVSIVDEVVQGTSGNLDTKTTPVIKNTGNVDEYIRLAIVGNWFDSHSANGKGADQIVAPWGGVSAKDECTFTHLNGLIPSWEADRNDGFYYFTYKLKPGETIPADRSIFTSAVAGACPDEFYEGAAHLELDLIVQAFDASRVDDMKGYNWNTDHYTEGYIPTEE